MEDIVIHILSNHKLDRLCQGWSFMFGSSANVISVGVLGWIYRVTLAYISQILRK